MGEKHAQNLLSAAPPLRVEAEHPLDEGTEWVVGHSTWTPGLSLLHVQLNQKTPGLLLFRLDGWTSLYLQSPRMSDLRYL